MNDLRDPDRQLSRTPPQNIELEMSVLGGIMLEPKYAYPLAADYLTRESFYLDGHGLIFELMGELHKRQIPPDSDMILDELRARGLLEKVGGAGVVLSMLNSVASAANVEYHAKKIAEKASLRALIRVCTQIIEECYRQEMPIDEVLETADDAIRQLADNNTDYIAELIRQSMDEVYQGLKTRAEIVAKAKAENKPVPQLMTGLPTGFPELDKPTRGLRPGELTVIGGHTSEGKTSLALTMVQHMAITHNIPVAYFSTEMSADSLSTRLLSMGTKHWIDGKIRGVPTTAMESPEFDKGEWNVLTQAFNNLAGAPIHWVVRSAMTPKFMEREVRQLLRLPPGKRPRVIFIDYIQRLKGDSNKRSLTEEVTEISTGIKDLAIWSKLPVVALSQLDKQKLGMKPNLTHLGWASRIAQDADVVMLIWRLDEHDKKETSRRRDAYEAQWYIDHPAEPVPECDFPEVDIIIDKNRNGPCYSVPVYWYPEISRFLAKGRI